MPPRARGRRGAAAGAGGRPAAPAASTKNNTKVINVGVVPSSVRLFSSNEAGRDPDRSAADFARELTLAEIDNLPHVVSRKFNMLRVNLMEQKLFDDAEGELRWSLQKGCNYNDNESDYQEYI